MSNNIIENKLNQIERILENDFILKECDLFTGKTGIALFLFYYWKFTKKDEAYNRGSELLINSINSIYKYRSFSFCNGLCGIAWSINHLIKHEFIEGNSNDIMKNTDNILYLYMKKCILEKNFDLLHGSLGVALYFLERDNKQSKKYTFEFIDSLHKSSIRMKKGIAWKDINNTINFGLSHGLSSILVYLLKVYMKYGSQGYTKEIILDLLSYMVSNTQNINKYSSYLPLAIATSVNETSHKNAQLGWCYGDLGVASAFWKAYQTLGNTYFKDLSLELLDNCIRRTDNRLYNVIDAGFCHGSAGIAYIFFKMYTETNNLSYKLASDFWYNDVIKKSSFENGLAGFKAWRPKEHGGSINQYGLLEGISGIGLSLLSYINKRELPWDECFML